MACDVVRSRPLSDSGNEWIRGRRFRIFCNVFLLGLEFNRPVCIFHGMKTSSTHSEARQRILETADRLFYQHGIRAVGIDRIIAEAEVAKMSLYKHFASKDDLILAVLKHREESLLSFFSEAMERHEKRSKNRLKAFFSALKELFETDNFRGCAFQNATIELADPNHPGTKFVQEHKQRFRQFLFEIIVEVLGKSAGKLAPIVNLLVEGAVVTAVIQRSAQSADLARDATMKLLEQEKTV